MRANPLYLSNFLNACCSVTAEGVRFSVTLYALHLHASPAVVGMLASLFSLVPAASSVATGRWMDRIGPRTPMLMAALAMVPGAALAFVWHDLAALFVASIVVGACQNVFFVGNLHILGRLGGPGDRVRNFSVFTMANSAALLAGPLLAGFSIDWLGYPPTFLLLSLVPLVPALVIGLGGLAPASEAAAGEPAARTAGSSSRSGGGPFGAPGGTGGAGKSGALELLRAPALRGVFAIAFASSASILLYIFLMPLYGVSIGLSASWIGVVMGSFSVTMVLIRLFAPVLARLMRPWQLILTAMSVSGVLLLGVPFLENAPVLIGIGLLLGASLGLSSPIILALLSEGAPQHRVGEVLGLRMTMVNLILTAVPLIAGVLGAALGLAPVFWIISALLLGSCFMSRDRWRASAQVTQRAGRPP